MVPLRQSTRTFVDACTIQSTVTTSGFCGGDSGHGSATVIEFDDLGGADIRCAFVRDAGVDKKIAINVHGDAELRAMIKAFRFVADSLEALARE